MRGLRLAAAAFAATLALPASAQLKTDVVFTEYSALSSTAELVRRLSSPLSAIRIQQETQRAGQTLRGQQVELAREHYSLYVPDDPHALLVFIPPWPRAEIPRQCFACLRRLSLTTWWGMMSWKMGT